MQRLIRTTLTLGAAVAALAGSAQAQGKSGKHDDHGRKADRRTVVMRSNGDVERDRDRDRDRDWDRERRRDVPPGLAKKPGGMPPGQYKKLPRTDRVYRSYGVDQGSQVLADILRSRGYTVTRLATDNTARIVYYRTPNGTLQRAVVRPGGDRLSFINVPAEIYQAVLARLY